MIERRKFIAGMAAMSLLPSAKATPPRTVPEHEKWHFDIVDLIMRNACLQMELTDSKICELQIRFSHTTVDRYGPNMTTIFTIESVGQGPLDWSP